MNNIQLIITVITSLITAGTFIYNTGFKNSYTREQQYYKNILQPFIESVVKNDNVNAVKMLKQKINHTDDSIPKYVLYLVENNKKDELRKVLLYDYFDIYHNDETTINRIEKIINKILIYITLALVFFILFEGIICIIMGLINIIMCILKCDNVIITMYGFSFSNIVWSLIEISVGIICFPIYIFGMLFIKLKNIDNYSVKKVKIKRLINRKVKSCDKRIDKCFY